MLVLKLWTYHDMLVSGLVSLNFKMSQHTTFSTKFDGEDPVAGSTAFSSFAMNSIFSFVIPSFNSFDSSSCWFDGGNVDFVFPASSFSPKSFFALSQSLLTPPFHSHLSLMVSPFHPLLFQNWHPKFISFQMSQFCCLHPYLPSFFILTYNIID